MPGGDASVCIATPLGGAKGVFAANADGGVRGRCIVGDVGEHELLCRGLQPARRRPDVLS